MSDMSVTMNVYGAAGFDAVLPGAAGYGAANPNLRKFKTEAVRKSLHCLIAFGPALASLSRGGAVCALLAGAALYAWFEELRLSGVRVPVVSSLTALASRSRDAGRFVRGPVTLALGAALALVLFPPAAAAVAIYALAFGDGLASLVGRVFGRVRPAFMNGKSVEGSLACAAAVFTAALAVTGRPWAALGVAVVTTLIEALPLRDWDNLVIPLAAGLAACALL